MARKIDQAWAVVDVPGLGPVKRGPQGGPGAIIQKRAWHRDAKARALTAVEELAFARAEASNAARQVEELRKQGCDRKTLLQAEAKMELMRDLARMAQDRDDEAQGEIAKLERAEALDEIAKRSREE